MSKKSEAYILGFAWWTVVHIFIPLMLLAMLLMGASLLGAVCHWIVWGES